MNSPEKYDYSAPQEACEGLSECPAEGGGKSSSESQSGSLPVLLPKKERRLHEIRVAGLVQPILFADSRGTLRPTVANVAICAGLSSQSEKMPSDGSGNIRQEHHSQLAGILAEYRSVPFALERLFRLLEEMLLRLQAESGSIEFSFPVIAPEAPLSRNNVPSGDTSEYEVNARIDKLPGSYPDLLLGITMPIERLLDCTNERNGPGNVSPSSFRPHLRILTRLRAEMEPEEMVRIVKEEASYDVLGIFKRRDTRWIVRRAQPRFSGDLLRDVATRLAAEPRIAEWSVRLDELVPEETKEKENDTTHGATSSFSPDGELCRNLPRRAEQTTRHPFFAENQSQSRWHTYAEISGENRQIIKGR